MKDIGWTGLIGGALGSERCMTGLYLLFVAGLAGTTIVILFQDDKGWALPIALATAASLWGLERLETRYTTGDARIWHGLRGSLLPVVMISLATLAVCFPSLKDYFIYDDFGYIHFFHKFSLAQVLRLFHTDIAQFAWGEPRQELRPFFGLYFMMSYQLWGLHPLGYHLDSVFLHLINSLLVFLIVKGLTPREHWRAGLAALLFAVLPLNGSIFFWATGSSAELIPDFFYLASFVCFMRYRATRLTRYLAVSMVAFAGCLSSKESAVTLPVMLISYDLFRKATAEGAASRGNDQVRKKWPWGVILTSILCAALLLAYLEVRRAVMGDYLQVSHWGNIRDAFSSPAGFWLRLTHFMIRIGGLQAFNFRELLSSNPAPVLGIVLGIYLVWVYSLLRYRAENRRSIAPILYFGFVWYSISCVPLLIVDLRPDHLYLPAVGLCIATSFLAFPAGHETRKRPGYIRLLSFGFLVLLSGSQLWKRNAEWPPEGEMRKKMVVALQAAIEDLPTRTLVIVPAPPSMRAALDGALPFILQDPFTSGDFYSRLRIIEDPTVYGRPWWGKTKPALASELAGPPNDRLAICVLSWDDQNNSVQRSKRISPRRILRDCVTKSLGKPVESIDSLGDAEGRKLVEALASSVGE